MRKIKSIGLETELSRSPGNCCLKLLLVLPMLPPEYIMPGFNAIKKWAMEKNVMILKHEFYQIIRILLFTVFISSIRSIMRLC